MAKQNTKNSSQKISDKTKPAKQKNLPIAVVGIGASAGGLEAFSQLLRNLPDDTGMAFVLIQHLDPKHTSALPELLGRVTSLPVKQITQSIHAAPNHIYVIPPNKYIQINKGKLILSDRVKSGGIYLPIDFFFRSLASDQKNKAIGIILSGTASDGTVGLKYIKAEGGLTFTQDEYSAKYPGMIQSAIESGNVDIVLPPEKIAKELVRIGHHPYILLNQKSKTEIETEKKDEFEETKEESLTELYNGLKKATGVDFSNYKINTVKRRINRRMVINKLRKIEDYVKFVKEDKTEVMSLYNDLLINVTTFFRDPEVFEHLASKIYPKLIENNSENVLRIWVPGCATGEEVYSIAISLLEYLDSKASKFSIQIFATDISEPSIDRARAGIYPESVVKELPLEIQKNYFVRLNGSYQVSKLLRELCIFARQDISKDPPFSRLDLISCRNLLIYLSPDLQKKIIPIFHYALKPNGYLLLGTSETIGSYGELFQIVDKKCKVYERQEYKRNIDNNFSFTTAQYVKSDEKKYNNFPDELDVLKEADKIILSKYAPAAVLINHNLEIIQFRGKIKDYLDPLPGDASLSIFKMIKEGINIELHTSIRKAADTKKPVTIENIKIDSNGLSKHINLEVVPLKASADLKKLSFLILFNEQIPETSLKPDTVVKKETEKKSSQNTEDRIEKLKEELSITKEHLQSIIHQREASNEELKSALEELQSSNEELQSTNEEMETAREELQSTNEELLTVNYELESRNTELDEANSHLNNILSSINIPIVLLGRDLTVKRFTQKAENIWNLIPSDIGRPFSHLKPNFEVPDLKEKILDVMDELESIELEIMDNENKSYSMKIRPYKSSNNKIEGVIILLYDIDLLKKVAFENERKNYFEAILNSIREPILILDKDLKVDSANKSFYDTFKLKQKNTDGKFIYDLGKKQWDIPALKKLLENILPKNKFFENYEIEHKFSSNGTKKMLLNARKIEAGNGREELILLAFEKVH